MKRKPDYILMNVGIQNIVVRDTNDGAEPEGLIRLNKTGVFLWEKLEQDITAEELANCLAEKYHISPEMVRGDVDAFLAQLMDGNALEK